MQTYIKRSFYRRKAVKRKENLSSCESFSVLETICSYGCGYVTIMLQRRYSCFSSSLLHPAAGGVVIHKKYTVLWERRIPMKRYRSFIFITVIIVMLSTLSTLVSPVMVQVWSRNEGGLSASRIAMLCGIMLISGMLASGALCQKL